MQVLCRACSIESDNGQAWSKADAPRADDFEAFHQITPNLGKAIDLGKALMVTSLQSSFWGIYPVVEGDAGQR